ncbi:Leucine--tRNA ligase [Chlorella vulgaris]
MSESALNQAEPQNHTRRDLLLQIQHDAQAKWESSKVFESDAPDSDSANNKFFGTFPYPYMNGVLHLGHAFSMSKLEFAAAYHRLCGKNVLFPQGFHCTGMPIKACADKLARELSTYGNPPQFPKDAAVTVADEQEDVGGADPTKFVAKKSKAAAKKGVGNTQWDILLMSGIPAEQIPKFADPAHWLRYFPPLAMRDLTAMGCGIDWRRSFITTDVNPYYDSFVQWQFEVLRKKGKIVKDKRYAVYSPLDGQPCADHDRASGEGVGPQEYTLIKMRALELKGKLAALQGQGPVYLMAATLRPETMYGQTNCWALPDGDYGAFQGLGGEVYVMTDRSALNLSYQDRMPETGRPHKLLELKGFDLLGGTGIVTSVPSDAPDDYAALMDLVNKPKLREKYAIHDDWVIPIIDIPGFGTTAAVKVCLDLKIQSQNDTKKLAEAKQLVYLKGFTDGIMIAGQYAGKKVSEAKSQIRNELISSGEAMIYSEPEKPVTSRSGDDCVVALTDQWYMTYGEEEWREATQTCLQRMEVYDDTTRHQFTHTLGWLNQWACSRSFGLGTRLPWDPVYLVESLSDSTIYMAYYTVAHILQQGNMYGEAESPVKPEHLTHETMRREFEFWYPFDLRVSGKDLIQNHLTFCLYNHTAIWAQQEQYWPRSMRCNGHLLLNAEKMSKSTGNFKTLQQAIAEYSSDAMRIALADAGDALDDANFEHTTANGAILRLTKELAWIEETLSAGQTLRDEPPTSFIDRVFDNEINIAVHRTRDAYDKMLFREALKHGWYDLLNARDMYRFACGPDGGNQRLLLRFIEVSTLLLVPICPHTSEHIWSSLLQKPGLAIKAGWPASGAPNYVLQQVSKYLDDTIVHLRKGISKAEAPSKAKKGNSPAPPKKVTAVDVYVVDRFGGWHAKLLGILNEDPELGSMDQKTLKQTVLPFAKFRMETATRGGAATLKDRLPFDELALLQENHEFVLRALQVGVINIHAITFEEQQGATAQIAACSAACSPADPGFWTCTAGEVVHVPAFADAGYQSGSMRI